MKSKLIPTVSPTMAPLSTSTSSTSSEPSSATVVTLKATVPSPSKSEVRRLATKKTMVRMVMRR